MTVPKGVTSFDAKIKIIDDTLVEGTEKLTLSVANHQATASITDNDFNDVEIASFQAANSNGAEKTKGYNQFSVFNTIYGKTKEKQHLTFTNSDAANNVDEDDVDLVTAVLHRTSQRKIKGLARMTASSPSQRDLFLHRQH